MKELHSILARLSRPDPAPAGLATLCRVGGSSYRRPGARLLLGGGTRTGSISGGCLEDDVLLRGEKVVRSGLAQAVTYDTTAENDLVWGVGLGCHGVVDLVIERLTDGAGWAECLQGAFERRVDAATAVVFQAGSPAALGTRAALTADGRTWAHGDGSALAAGLRAALAGKCSQQAQVDGLPGQPWVFFEYMPRPERLLIFGAGNDAQPLCELAAGLGYLVEVLDPRPAYATPERFPAAASVTAGAPAELAARFAADERTAAVVMTHHYVQDRPLLRALLPLPLAYLGLLGPRQRAGKILADLAADGFTATPEMRARLHAPVGLDLGATSPESVALAILAEITAVRSGRDGRPLRERSGTIHGD